MKFSKRYSFYWRLLPMPVYGRVFNRVLRSFTPSYFIGVQFLNTLYVVEWEE